MTGFGRGKYENEGRTYTVEIKSVNHKYSDINARLPRFLNSVEDKIRKRVAEVISRGKIDIFISFENYSSSGTTIRINKELAKEYIKEFLLLVLYDAQKHNRRRKERKSTANMYIKGATSYINAHFADDISVKELAAILSLNQNYLIRLFKTELGTTPNKYILETRLLRARLMLLQTDQTVKEVALSCGFNVPSYLTKCFNDRFGQNPLDFRKNGN